MLIKLTLTFLFFNQKKLIFKPLIMIYKIALGHEICLHLFNENYEGVAECIGYVDGEIIEWDSENDSLSELLDYVVNTDEYAFVTDEEMEFINEFL